MGAELHIYQQNRSRAPYILKIGAELHIYSTVPEEGRHTIAQPMRSIASLPLCALWGPHTHTPQKQNSPTIQALGIEPCMRLILGPALEKITIYESITTEAK